MRSKILVICLVLVTVFGVNAQQPQVPRVTGFFSDMQYIREAGDLVGTEVWIVYARGGYYASVQIAEGEPDPPYLVPVKVVGLTGVEFTIREPLLDQDGRPVPDAVTNFEGTVSKAGLLFSKPERKLLKRRNTYWQ